MPGGASTTGESLVLLAAPDGVLAGVRDALRDLSALGLIEEFLWVRLAPVDDQLSISADKIIGGAAEPVTVQQVLSENQYHRVRVCCLSAVLPPSSPESTSQSFSEPTSRSFPEPTSRSFPEPTSPPFPEPTSPPFPEPVEGRARSTFDPVEAERELVDLVRRSSGTGEIERLRCVITRPGGVADAEDLGRDGWHNVIISPEDARGPGLGHQVLGPTDDPALIGGPAATAVAGLTGLWRGLPEAPLDDVAVPPGQSVRVGRAFFRSLDASAVEDSIRDGVTSVSGGLPAVRVAGAQSLRIGPPPSPDAKGRRADRAGSTTSTRRPGRWPTRCGASTAECSAGRGSGRRRARSRTSARWPRCGCCSASSGPRSRTPRCAGGPR